MVKVVLVRIEVWHPHLICGLPFHFLGAFGRMRSLFIAVRSTGFSVSEEHWLFSHWPCREVEVLEEEDVRGDRGLSVFRLRAVSRLTLVVRCTEIGYSVSTQVLGFRFGCGWCCVVGFLFGCCWFCVLLLCVSAWWNRGIADEVTMASYGRAVTGTAVMARSANEEKKKQQKPSPHSDTDRVTSII